MPPRTGAVLTSRLRFARHAERRIRERRIGEEAVLEAVLKPTMLFYDVRSKTMVAFAKQDEKHILVVFVKEEGDIRVVTAFKTSEAEDIIRRKQGGGLWLRVK